jgi:transcriptional regulator NrdR family protein
MIVIKRDGRKQEFDFQKVVDVIHNTYDAINQEVPDKFIEQL